MKILIVSQYFWPESFIINDLILHLHRLGHEVTVLTGKPNYPDGILFEGYSEKGIQQESYQGKIDVFRAPLRPRDSAGSRELFLNYFSFVFAGLRYFPSFIKDRKVDAILVFMPSPITSVIPAIPLKWAKKAHLAVWIQDLWPESLAATGHLRHPLLLKLVGWLVKGIYHFTDSLLIQSRAFRDPVGRLAKSDKIVYYPNSVDLQPVLHDKEAGLPDELVQLLGSNFCLVFAGNIGKAQSIETIVEAAKRLQDHEHIKIVLVGSGSMLEWVKNQKQTFDLNNLVLTGRYPMQSMPTIYKYAAALLVTLKDEEIFSYTIPSKIQAYLSTKRPIIAALNGEGTRIIEESGAGLTGSAEDAEKLAANILAMYAMSQTRRDEMGANGYDYYREHFEMRSQAQRLIEILAERINNNREES